MSLVALHTQALGPEDGERYLGMLERALRAARLNNSFPDRKRMSATLAGLQRGLSGRIYEQLYVDARAGLPNMAAFTRVVTDQQLAVASLGRMGERVELERRRDEAEVFARLADKHDYLSWLKDQELAPVDLHRVLLRRHDPASGTASFRIELTKLDGSGLYLHLVIELTQVAGVWRKRVVDLDKDGESAAASQAFYTLIYRCAALDAETLFIRLHGIEGVSVERVQRGILGPILFYFPGVAGVGPGAAGVGPGVAGVGPLRTHEPEGILGDAWQRFVAGPGARLAAPEMAATFASDAAAIDIRDEKSNDPLSPLLSATIEASERARYQGVRQRYPFKVFKDRKFVATRGLHPLLQAICDAAATKNLIYDLR